MSSSDPLDAPALELAFSRARDEVQRAARFPIGLAPELTCRYCGLYWRRWLGSKLDGHARCYVTDAFKRDLKRILKSPIVTYDQIAKVIDVTPSVVRSWTFPIRAAKLRRADSRGAVKP